jgi:FkbM family methyltransferase
MRIRSGPNRGRLWSIVSAGRGAMAGTFEQARVEAISLLVEPGDCVWDIGAHKGYITLACASRVGDAGHVYSFEPGPPNLEFLRRHVAWNGLENVTVLPYAVSARDGTARFGGSGSSITYRLGQGDYEVRVRCIASLLAEGLRPATVVKIDVEGNEHDVLKGGSARLPRNSLMIVAIHSHEQYLACTQRLREDGWRVVQSAGVRRNLSQRPVVWEDDPDILAIGPKRAVNAAALAAFEG